jgi:hypothetical protein
VRRLFVQKRSGAKRHVSYVMVGEWVAIKKNQLRALSRNDEGELALPVRTGSLENGFGSLRYISVLRKFGM